jgi:hypothetical protein
LERQAAGFQRRADSFFKQVLFCVTANNETHVQYLSIIRVHERFRCCSDHERSLCAPSLVSSLGVSVSLDITFSNCDHRPSTWLNSLPTYRNIVSECNSYCHAFKLTAITPSKLRFSLFMFCSTFSRLAATSPTRSSRCCSK